LTESPPPIRVLIVDDEPLSRANIRRALATASNWAVVAECPSAAAARAELARGPVDVVLLDIQMPSETGLSLAATLSRTERPPLVVFVTAYADHAVEAFELYALDYLLKPFSDRRLKRMIERVEATIAGDGRQAYGSSVLDFIERSRLANPGNREPLKRIAVRSVGRIDFVDVRDVLWVEAAGNYVELHLPDRRVLHRVTMGSLEAQLDPEAYLRVHRKALVRRDQCVRLRTKGDGSHAVDLKCGDVVDVSDSRLVRVRAALTGKT
jgi:two-component system LytT family response regulator